MPKYKIEMGSLVTKLMKRTFTVSAPDEQTAIERAENRFRYACEQQVYTECGDTIFIDSVEELDD